MSRFGLGTMALAGASPEDADRIVGAALDAGITLLDTADVYGDGRVEELLGRVLTAERREKIVLATKFGLPMGSDPKARGCSARWIRTAVEGSLRRLRVDHIDLYQAHRPDPETPLAETLEALHDLVTEGKVRFTGTSAYPAEQLVEAQWLSQRHALAACCSEQPAYSMLVRSAERSVLHTCRRFGVGVITWSPLNGGWLTGKYRRGQPPPPDSRAARGNPFVVPTDTAKLTAVESLEKIAQDAGLRLADLALAWCLEHPAVTSVLLGPRTPGQLDGVTAAQAVSLDEAMLDAIDQVVPPGVDLDPRNTGWHPDALTTRHRRRRPADYPTSNP
ncbi:aldo/keto reductase [Rhizohabitans arisaemae]|uniref:aldo/keto reductase n=1 Tax=Rhizohabitans arisaemae TaxID=2720610 RepID=UPI0024B223A8|nr:aldo/keto reductase [Rhizohabitans arisaemae]